MKLRTALQCVALIAPMVSIGADTTMQTMHDTALASPMANAPSLPIAVPESLRKNYVHLGSWLVADANAPGHGFHDVYTELSSVEAYRKTGRFPDGTTLVKEIRGIGSGTLTTGAAQWATEPGLWFVMVKDANGRFRDSPLWGDGWLWALYEAKAPTTNVATSYGEACQGCHIPAAKTDHVFVQGYPTLKRE